METAERSEAATESPRPTHISVHIHQESSLAKLLMAGCSLLRSSASTWGKATQTLASTQLLAASWVVQLVLGVLSGVLGGFLFMFWPTNLSSSGAAIWTGVVAVLAGAAAFIYEKRGGFCWALLRILLWLASFCTALSAIIIASDVVRDYHYYITEDNCSAYRPRGWPTEPPHTPSPTEAERQHLCLSHLNMLKALYVSLHAMLLGVWVLLLLASVTPVCLYCWTRCFAKEKKDQKQLLAATGM
ncbi:transmembrane protein 176A [Dipodomys merriami]|uniref:transmembrane protein 176A n=1 Tax=Dipodomys merriami TaxID=94247 RepID=UPI0038558254